METGVLQPGNTKLKLTKSGLTEDTTDNVYYNLRFRIFLNKKNLDVYNVHWIKQIYFSEGPGPQLCSGQSSNMRGLQPRWVDQLEPGGFRRLRRALM